MTDLTVNFPVGRDFPLETYSLDSLLGHLELDEGFIDEPLSKAPIQYSIPVFELVSDDEDFIKEVDELIELEKVSLSRLENPNGEEVTFRYKEAITHTPVTTAILDELYLYSQEKRFTNNYSGTDGHILLCLLKSLDLFWD